MKTINRELLISNWDKLGYKELADLVGSTPEYVRKLGRKLNLPHKRINSQAVAYAQSQEVTMTNEQMIAHLESQGILIHRQPIVENREFSIDTSRFVGDTVKLGIVTDTHLGSMFQQLTYLREAYRFFAEQGITDVLHCGDMVAGNGKVYKGQVYELFSLGADSQMEYAINNYPKEDGITTHVISGNHDLSFLTTDGLDIVKNIAKERQDINYLGQYGAYVNIGNVRIRLHHGDGGVAYARSYKLQKLVEQISPELKPEIFLSGHWHITAVLPNYRNVYSIACGCFESQTPYLVRKGLFPEIGFTILEVTLNDTDREHGITGIKYEWHPYFVPLNNDF